MRQLFVVVLVTIAVAATLGFLYVTGRMENPVTSFVREPAPGAPRTSAPPANVHGNIVAEAVVLPVQFAALSLPVAGPVAEILAAEGDQVAAGQVIARLRSDREVIAVAQMQATVDQARAQVDLLTGGARDEELAAAQAAIDAAQAQVDILTQGPHPDDVAAAQAALAAAQAQYATVAAGADDQMLIAARAEMANAEALMTQAQRAYDRVSWSADIGTLPEAAALQTATNEYEAALARYEDLAAGAEPGELAEAAAVIDQARALLDRMQAPPTESEIAAAEAAVRQAQAAYDLIAAGSRPAEIAMAQAALSAAETELMQAQLTLAERELRAPFDGVLASMNLRIGQEVVAGEPVVQLADQSAWLVKTTDFNEINISEIGTGDRVNVSIDALPDLELTGRVIHITPMGVSILGDTTYTVTVQLDEDDDRLRWNMSARAEIKAND